MVAYYPVAGASQGGDAAVTGLDPDQRFLASRFIAFYPVAGATQRIIVIKESVASASQE
jgi:hypothetical protein